MRRITAKILWIVFIINIIWTLNFLIVPNSLAITKLSPEYGDMPILDGTIDKSTNEWKNASKIQINLFSDPNATSSDKGIPVNLWVMFNETDITDQNDDDLFICISVQFELEEHKPSEFIGILISNNEEGGNKYIDAKFGQFSNLGTGINESFEFRDYHIENDKFIMDKYSNGSANATLKNDNVIYEFVFPLNNDQEEQDVFLDKGDYYLIKIVYGEDPNYNSSIKKENYVETKINYPPQPPEVDPFQFYMDIACIVIFSIIAGIAGFYAYKIIVLRKRLERMRR